MGTFGGSRPKISVGTAGSSFPQAQGTYDDGKIAVPPGALDRWFAYCNPASTAAARRDVIIFGDSTTWGSGPTPGYSWVQRLRDRITGAGYADGGKGIFAGGEGSIGYDAPEVNGLLSTTFSGFADAFDNLVGSYIKSVAAGETLVYNCRATGARLWYSARGDAGDFTYSVDGGAVVRVSAWVPGGYTGQVNKFIPISGLSAGTTHTITVTNLGGRAAAAPVGISTGLDGLGTGTAPAGTYYYVATYVFGGGETVASNVASVTTGGSRAIGLTVPSVGENSRRIYRGTSPTGPFGLITPGASTSGTGYVLYSETSLATADMGTNPPTTGTTNLNTSSQNHYSACAAINATGIALQKQAVSGATINNFIGGFTSLTADIPKISSAMGLTNGPASATLAPDASYGADRINPVLAMWHLGFNDLSNQANTDYTVYVNGIKKFAAACRAASCDGIVLSGQLPYNASWPTYGAGIYAAMKATALSEGLAFVDFFYPIGGSSLSYSGGASNPHLSRSQYVTQADWIWDNLLSI